MTCPGVVLNDEDGLQLQSQIATWPSASSQPAQQIEKEPEHLPAGLQ